MKLVVTRGVGRKPKLQKPRREHWSEEKKRTFLAALAETANIAGSLRKVGMGSTGLYALRRRSAEFRAAWDEALSEGYAIPREIDAVIDAALVAVSPIRQIANVVRVGSAGYRKLVTTGGAPSGWAAEGGARVETDTPVFHEVVPPAGDLYANPAASQAMLDDAAFDVEAWLADEVAREFGRAEGQAFVAGNGTNKPKGFITYTTTNEADTVRAWGSLQYVASGAAGAFAASNPQDKLIDLVQALRSPYRQGAVFVMNSATASAIRKFKTTDGAFLWSPGLAAGQPDTLLGYAANGDSVRGAVETLAAVVPLSISDDGAVLRISDGAPEPVTLEARETGASAEAGRKAHSERERDAAGVLPDEVAVAYYEPARDYQSGLQRARRGGPGRKVEKIDLPAALVAEEAKGLAEHRLAAAWSRRARVTVSLPWRRLGLRPGGSVILPGEERSWRIAGWTLDRMVAELKLVGIPPAAGVAPGAAPGRPTPGADDLAGETVLHLLDLPPLEDTPSSTPRLWIAAAGTGVGWRRAELTVSLDAGANWAPIGSTARAAVIGSAVGALGEASASVFDGKNSVDIDLLHDGMWLEGRTDAALIGGANLAMLGDELIQFGSVEQIAPLRFRLGRLLRGRRGTEWAIGGHVAGEYFVLVEAAALLPHDLPAASIGTTVKMIAQGVGDDEPVEAETLLTAHALRPPAPVQLSAVRLADDTIRIGWTRRSRTGWTWIDGVDVPLGEESERYRLAITPSSGAPRVLETATPHHDYSVAEQTADGALGASSLLINVAQLGSVAPSLPPAERSFAI